MTDAQKAIVARIAARDKRYAAAAGGAKPAAAKSRPLPCVHVGEELTGAARDLRKLGHARKWVYCGHPDQPLGEAVCGCRGCGPRCPGYTAPSLPAAPAPV